MSIKLCPGSTFWNLRYDLFSLNAVDTLAIILVSTKDSGLPLKSPKLDFNQDDNCATGSVHCSANEECVSESNGQSQCQCSSGFERNRYSNTCVLPGSCDLKSPTPCDLRKNERCLLHPSGRYHTCQCASTAKRHPVTDICLKNECIDGSHDCGINSKCIDTDEGYLCVCPTGFLDQSTDLIHRPGRVCVAEQNECLDGGHNCSPDSICTDLTIGFTCQ